MSTSDTPNTTIHDLRRPGWGRNIEPSSNPPMVFGCLTPLPKEGDYAVDTRGRIFRFGKVEPMGNPRDGFSADLMNTGYVFQEDGPLPPVAELEEAMRDGN